MSSARYCSTIGSPSLGAAPDVRTETSKIDSIPVMATRAEPDWSAWSREAVRLMQERNHAWIRDYGLQGCQYDWSLDHQDHAVAHDEMIVTMPSLIAKHYAGAYRLHHFQPPVKLPSLDIAMASDPRSMSDAGIAWLAEQIRVHAEQLRAGSR